MTDIITPTTHVFDETGVLPENYIENEQRDLAVRNVRAVAARFGSFFVDGFRMRDANGFPVDPSKYKFALYRNVISAKLGKNVCSAVIITDPNVVAPVFIDYHCVGGPYGASNEHILELFNQLQTDDRPVNWPNILGKPDSYNPAHHFQDIGDLYGAEYWVEALERLADAFLMGDSASHDEIWRRMDQIRTEMLQAIADQNTSLKAYIDQHDAALQTNINTVDTRVTNVRQECLNASAAVDTRLTNVRQELLNADSVINDRITSVQQTLQTNINTVDARITSVRQELLNADGVINDRITSVQGTLQTNINNVDSRVTTVQNNLQGQINSTNSTLAAHTSNTNNPHNTTANQTGTYNSGQIDGMIAAINNNLNGNFVKKNIAEELALTSSGGYIYCFMNGAWRAIWPAQWS